MNPGKRRFPICFLAIALSLHSILFAVIHAQSIPKRFERLSVVNGLSKDEVICVFQDNDGFMWFGSQGGLDRYDGERIVSYYGRISDSALKSDQITVAICEDSYDGLWFNSDTNGLVLFNKKTETIWRFRADPENNKGLSDGNVRAIFEDSEKNLWLATNRGGLNLFTRKDSSFIHFQHDPEDTSSIASNSLTSIAEDKNGNIWLATTDGFLCRYDRSKKTFQNFKVGRGMGLYMPQILNPLIIVDSDNIIWFASGSVMIRFDPVTHTIKPTLLYTQKGKPVFSPITSLAEVEKNEILISTYGDGLFQFNTLTGKCINYTHSIYDVKGINSNWLSQICRSKDGVIWIGSHTSGINKYDVTSRRFLQLEDFVGSEYFEDCGHSFLTMCETPDGNILMGTANHGVLVYDRKYRTIRSLAPELDGMSIFGLHKDQNNDIWFATFMHGLWKYDWNSKVLRNITTFPGSAIQSLNFNLSKVFVDTKNRIWLAYLGKGLVLYDMQTNKFLHFLHVPKDTNSLSGNDVFKIFEDRQGNIWVGTNHGVDLYKPGSNSFERIPLKDERGGNAQTTVYDIIQDNKDRIWIGSRNALYLYHPVNKTFTNYSCLRNNAFIIVYSIFEDKSHVFWLGTNAGIQRFEPETGVFSDYSLFDDTRYISYYPSSGMISSDGFILFGSNKGITLFKPDNLLVNRYIPPVLITGLQVNHEPVTVGTGSSILKQSIVYTGTIRLNYKQSDLTFEFAALSYSNPDQNQYACMLENYDDDWMLNGNSGVADYKNLPPGKYVFKVKASNNHGLWTETPATLAIYIKPPLWRTGLFRILSVLVLSSLIVFIYMSRIHGLNKQKLRLEHEVLEHTKELNEANRALKDQHEELIQQHEEITTQNDRLSLLSEEILQKNSELEQHRSQLEQMVSERTKELVEAKFKAEESDRLKSAFLANMSHEIRTPMNAIVGFANLLKDEDLTPGERNEFIGIINSNSEVLLVLIDDILDLSLIEANQVILRKEVLSLNEILDNVFSAFSLMNKKVELTIKLNNELHALNLKINTDRVRLKQILTNLMNNAYKFTAKGTIELGMKIQNEDLAIYVKDTGIGISEEDLPLIFERFRKSEVRKNTLYRGTGLGLAISKALSQLLGGELKVESRIEEGSVFSVVFPLSLTTSAETVVKEVPLHSDLKKWTGKNILIVEDEQANYLYVKKMLSRTAVGIHWAENGLEAVKMVSAGQPFDLILMDIKMPVMDGYEATKIIKSNSPQQIVIALTAYARPEDRIQFIGAGFDDYLTKPIKPTDFMGVISRYIS